ncbi:Lrp/AsnC family transcriptional regulator [Uniformispora flossi]|uniref:Lrp/AsnC family transcriptional regulator n=1 Tax=Uniformispora flossi TaxID=3390723 RepID=UPI003C2C3E70
MPSATQEVHPLDDADRALIEALQVSPRASWAAVGEVLALDPVTVARRWKRLSAEGVAWVTAYPAPDAYGTAALVDIAVAPRDLDAVAAAIAADPHVFTLERTTGAHSLTAIVGAVDLGDLTANCLDRIERIAGVRAVEIHLATRIFLEASRWRMRGLTPGQVTRLKRIAPPPAGSGSHGSPAGDDLDARIRAVLVGDGRAGGADVAAALGIGVHTARRRLDRLLGSGRLVFRCDVAQAYTGWPICATFRAAVAPAKVVATAQTLSTLPEIRMCMATTGPHNLHISVWLHAVDDVHRLENLLADRLPDLRIADRVVVLRPYKSSGRTLGPTGRALPAPGSATEGGPVPSG